MQNNFDIQFKSPSSFRGAFFLLLFFIGLVSFAQPQLKFKDLKKNFGFVKKGELVVMEYEFTNNGNQPLLITETKVECSCTNIESPKQPIAPGQSEKIVVKFDTKTVYDRQDRTVEVISNASNSSQKIRFKGVVLNK